MKTLHKAMMGMMLIGALTVSLGMVNPTLLPAWAQHAQHGEAQHPEHGEAQHGQHGQHGEMQHHDTSDAREHFHVLAEQLELSEDQMHALAEPFHEAFAAMQQLHSFHAVMVEHLSDEQQAKFAEMIHEMLGDAFGEMAEAQ